MKCTPTHGLAVSISSQYPIAPAYVRRVDSGTWLMTVIVCPLCGEQHMHGGGDGRTPLTGHRVSHCCEHVSGSGYVCAPLNLDRLAVLLDIPVADLQDALTVLARSRSHRGLPAAVRAIKGRMSLGILRQATDSERVW